MPMLPVLAGLKEVDWSTILVVRTAMITISTVLSEAQHVLPHPDIIRWRGGVCRNRCFLFSKHVRAKQVLRQLKVAE